MELVIVLILTLLNWFFALSEIAFVSVKRSRIEVLAKDGSLRAKTILSLMNSPEIFLSSVQVGITLIGIIAGAYGGSTIGDQLRILIEPLPYVWPFAAPIGYVLAIGGITYFSIVIGELVPKTIAMNNPEGFALWTVPFVRYFMIIVYPFVKLLSFSTSVILSILGVKTKNPDEVSAEELIVLLKNAHTQGVIEEEENDMHNNLFSFSDQTAKSIVTHRGDVEWVDVTDDYAAILSKVKESAHSKFLVCEWSIDHVVGIFSVKEFLDIRDPKQFDIRSIMIDPIFLPEWTSAIRILSTFKKKKYYLAVIVDEYGGTEGIVTLHDLIEVIVGDLPDEDDDHEDIIVDDGGTYLFPGRALVYEINQYFKQEVIPDDQSEYTTVAGYLIHLMGHMGHEWDRITTETGAQFKILDMDGVKIDKIEYIPPKDMTPEGESQKVD